MESSIWPPRTKKRSDPSGASAVQDDPGASPTRLAGGLERTGAAHDRVRPAEVQVEAREPVHPRAPLLQRIDLARAEAALAVEPVALDMDARVVDRLARPHAVVDHVDRDLGDRRPQAVR